MLSFAEMFVYIVCKKNLISDEKDIPVNLFHEKFFLN